MDAKATPPRPDWGAGSYEPTAAALEPASELVVALAAIGRSEQVLDIGCGTGNATLAAARTGASVTGLDPAQRLLDVARARAVAADLQAAFVVGDAEALPFPDRAFDAVLSVFGVIFAADAERAVEEIVRVLRPGGRALVTAWVPGGAIHESVGVMARAVGAIVGARGPAFAWHDAAALGEVVARNDATLEMQEAELAFTAPSLEAYVAQIQAVHPMTVAARPILDTAGTREETEREALAELRDGNEDPDGFRVTSRYRIARITRR